MTQNKIKKTYRLLLALALIVVSGAFSAVQAQPQSNVTPNFLPVGSWNVGPSGLAEARNLNGIKLPCVMANQFDNGYVMRISGGGGTLMALAIDFRQNIFTRGRQYDASLNIDRSFVQGTKGTAFTESVLIFNLRPMNGVYQALQHGNAMGLSVGNNPMHFGLANIGVALQELEQCFTSAPATQAAPKGDEPQEVYIRRQRGTAGFSQQAMKAGMTTAQPIPFEKPSKAAPVTKEEVLQHDPEINVPSQPLQATKMPEKRWQASAGEDTQTVLMCWADQAGVTLDWKAQGSSPVVHDVNMGGSFEDAVQTLLAQNAAATGLKGEIRGEDGVKAINASAQRPTPLVPQARQSASAPAMSGSQAAWYAPEGSFLQNVLEQWARKAGVKLVWQADQGFPLKQPINLNGSFEEAVGQALGQYENDVTRPTGRLNTDPGSGEKALFVHTDRQISRSF